MPAHRRLRKLRSLPLLVRIAAAADGSGQDAYLTGGYLRDRLGGRRPKAEIDLTVQNPGALLDALPLREGESAFVLDRERDTLRLVLAEDSPLACVDLTRFRGAGIEEDLRRRDFTVNALALVLRRGAPLQVLDPTGGLEDLRTGTLRPCSVASFRDDPLRAVRGVRLAVTLRFRLSPEARRLMKREGRRLRAVSGERIRDELFQTLQGPAPVAGAALLLELGLLGSLTPALRSSRRPHLPVLRRVASVVGRLPPSRALRKRLDEALQQGVQRGGVLALAALLSDRRGHRQARRASRRLVLGGRAAAVLEGLLLRPVPTDLIERPGAAGRPEMLRLFREHDDFIDEAVVLAACLHFPAGKALERSSRLLRRYRLCRRIFLRPPLLTGEHALRHLPVNPGPALGGLLRRTRAAQDLGAFRDLAGALEWARRLLPPGKS